MDGAYLVPDDLDGVSACFSPGVNNFKRFEDELAARGITSHLCDYSSDEKNLQTPLIPGLQTFRKAWLDTTHDADAISLPDWVEDLAPGGDDLLLQMDIEGAEYRNILACPSEQLRRFRIIVFELHSLECLLVPGIRDDVLLPFLEKLSADFVCVHAHPNNCCGEVMLPGSGANMPKLLEVTFLRKDRLTRSDTKYPPQLPHPLDIQRNVAERPPIILNEAWLQGPRADVSKIKALEEQQSYQQYRYDRLADEQRQLRTLFSTMSMVPGAPAADVTEVAVGCEYSLSSSMTPDEERGVIPRPVQGFFFHTEISQDPWIRIDLRCARLVSSVMITNRTDMCFDRATALYAIFYSLEGSMLSANCFELSDEWANGGQLTATAAARATNVRYVVIQSLSYTALHLSGIEVYAAPVVSSPPVGHAVIPRL
jgi:hypothetical protein